MAWASTPKRLDPALAISGDEYMITGAVYDNLVYVDPALQPQPMLATEWKPAADGLSWTVILRKGVKFHDGKDLTARDVVYSFQRVLDPQTASPGRTAMGPIKSVEPIDDTTVRFVLSSPFADLPVALGGTFGRIVPEGRSASDLNISPLGSGPFKFKEFVPGSHVSLVRNESYWDTGKARVNEVRLVTMPESAAQLAALTGGQVDLLFEANIPDLAALEKDPNVVVMEVDSPGFQPFTMAANLAPFDKPKVRQAMKLLLDRPGMVQAVWLGKAAPSPDTPVGQVNPFFWNGPIPKQDIEAAKRMLAEAGFPNGLDLECWTSNERNGLMEAAVTVKEMAAPAGVRIEIKNVPWAQHTTDVWKKKAFYVNNWFGRATIDETLYPYFHTQGSWNDGGPYSNPELDTLLDAGRSEADPAKRKDIYGKAQQIIANDGHFVVPYHSKYVGARRKSVQGYQLHPLRWVNLRGTSVGA
jgi:peptide/nickel transport system substrate-binding protein